MREFDVFGQLAALYECIDVAGRGAPGRGSHSSTCAAGYVDSAEDEWRRGALDADSLLGLAQVALVRERPGEAAVLAAEALQLRSGLGAGALARRSSRNLHKVIGLVPQS